MSCSIRGTAPIGWRWQQLSDYTAQLSASDYCQLKWPKSNDQVYVYVVTIGVRKLYRCQVAIVRQSLDAPLSQARYWASSDLDASPELLLAGTSKGSVRTGNKIPCGATSSDILRVIENIFKKRES